MRSRVSVLTVIALAVLALSGCGNAAVLGSPQPAGAEQRPPAAPGTAANADPKALIANAARTTRDEATCKFESKMEFKGQGDLAVGAWTSRGEFDFKNNRSKVDSVMDMGGKKMTMSILTDGNAIYMRTFAEGAPVPRWSKTDLKQLEASLGQLGGGAGGQSAGSDPMAFIDKIKEVATVTPDGSATIRGVPTTRYNVTIDPAKVPAEDKDIQADAAGSMRLYVDGKGRLARFEMAMADVAEGGSMSWDFFEYGASVKIDPPSPAEVEGN